jgi:hypothetical protein
VFDAIYASRMGTYTLKHTHSTLQGLRWKGVFFASVSFSPLEKEMKSRPGQGLTAVERNSKSKKSEEAKSSRATG